MTERTETPLPVDVGGEAGEAIVGLANAMQTAVGWIDRMGAHDLGALVDKLAAMHRIALSRLVTVEPDRAPRPDYVTPLPPPPSRLVSFPYPRCEYGGRGHDPDRCGLRVQERIEWISVGGPAHVDVCTPHGERVRANLARVGVTPGAGRR